MSGKPILTLYQNDICTKSDISTNEQIEILNVKIEYKGAWLNTK